MSENCHSFDMKGNVHWDSAASSNSNQGICKYSIDRTALVWILKGSDCVLLDANPEGLSMSSRGKGLGAGSKRRGEDVAASTLCCPGLQISTPSGGAGLGARRVGKHLVI